MKRFTFPSLCSLAALVLLVSLTVAPAFAQNTSPSHGLGKYWLVDDNAWDGVWIRNGDSSGFDARWSLDGEDDISASLTISIDGDTVTIDRVDPPNKWLVQSCHYVGTFQPDGVTIIGTDDCILSTGVSKGLNWSATVVYETPVITRNVNASRYRAAKGSQFDFICQPDSDFFSLWGTDIYTDDSSICTAAIHAGVMTSAGGTVNLQILEGQDYYESSLSNGVASNPYNKWRASYRFSNASAIIPQLTGSETALQYRGRDGKRYTLNCLAQDDLRPIWGTDIYTDDSPICTAAVHAGLITTAGGTITIEIMPGQASYESIERNGVTSRSYGGWPGSYRFV